MKTVKFYTLGCKVNHYETEAMKNLFEARGYTVTEEYIADVFVINTCTVTAVGDKKSRQMIGRAKKGNPKAVIAVVGCYSQVSPDEVRRLDEVDIILGTTDRIKIVDYVEDFAGFRIDAVKSDIKAEFEELPPSRQSRTRAVLKIQDGCNNFCTYCIIPRARGPIRSRQLNSAVNEAAALAARGFSEIVLTGIHLSSYGRETGLSLLDPIREIAAIPEIKRIRLSSLEPMILTDDFVKEAAKTEKLCPSFHVSMQSGCDDTLKRMNRRYSSAQYLEALDRLRTAFPGCGITTDVMVGFPGETEEEFEKSCDTVRKAAFAGIHVFPYSCRPGTPAAEMKEQLSNSVKSERSHIMIEIGEQLKQSFAQRLIGTTEEVLFEAPSGEYFEGLTKSYVRVMAKGGSLSEVYANVVIKEYKDGICFGEIEESLC